MQFYPPKGLGVAQVWSILQTQYVVNKQLKIKLTGVEALLVIFTFKCIFFYFISYFNVLSVNSTFSLFLSLF